jgi:hypothetical protein
MRITTLLKTEEKDAWCFPYLKVLFGDMYVKLEPGRQHVNKSKDLDLLNKKERIRNTVTNDKKNHTDLL